MVAPLNFDRMACSVPQAGNYSWVKSSPRVDCGTFRLDESGIREISPIARSVLGSRNDLRQLPKRLTGRISHFPQEQRPLSAGDLELSLQCISLSPFLSEMAKKRQRLPKPTEKITMTWGDVNCMLQPYLKKMIESSKNTDKKGGGAMLLRVSQGCIVPSSRYNDPCQQEIRDMVEKAFPSLGCVKVYFVRVVSRNSLEAVVCNDEGRKILKSHLITIA